MKNNIKDHFVKYIVGAILLLSTEISISQKHLVHLQYKPQSYTLLDTMFSFEEVDRESAISNVVNFDSMDVFITPKYIASIEYNSPVWVHTIYDRKTRIMRRHFISGDTDFFSEDSVMYYIHKDKELRKKAARLKDTLLIRDYPDIQKTIHGRKCHLITFPPYGWLYTEMDSFWVADIKNVPGLISPFYFLTKGIAFESKINDGVLSVLVTSEKRPLPKFSKEVFTIDPGKSELHQHQTQLQIVDVVKYILAFKARLP